MPSSKHGGKRRNAGRKAKVARPHAVSVKLSDAELAALDRFKSIHDAVSRAAALRYLLNSTRGA
jgi:hypothetical protein